MKHFEQLWEEAEELTHDVSDLDFDQAIHKAINRCCLLINYKAKADAVGHSPSEHPEIGETMSELLFTLCFLSKELNINVYAALQSAMDDRKVENYG